MPLSVGTQVLGPLVTPPSAEHVDVKHAFAAATAATHAPDALQVPPHAPAEQPVPDAATGFEHPPVPPSPELQVPARWHASDAVQVTGAPALQLPPWHESPAVHAFPSLQVVPFEATGFEHAPLEGSHVPAVWHASNAVHVSGVPPTHVPPWQASDWVQAFPSLQLVPLAATGLEHVPLVGLHVPPV